MLNKSGVAAVLIGVSAGAAHFVLPAPPQTERYDTNRRLMVGGVAIALAGAGATVLTGEKQYLAVAVVAAALMVAAYKGSEVLEAKYLKEG